MRLKHKLKKLKKLSTISSVSLALAASLVTGMMTAPAALSLESDSPVILSTEIVSLLDKNKTATLNASGELVDENGKIIGVITAVDPSVTVVKKEHPMAVIINDKSDRVMAASLYNRIAFLKNLVVDESNKGHVASDQVPTVIESLDKTEKELNTKVKSGNDLTFAEAITIGERLDQTANSLKRAKRFRLHTEELAPMVVVSPKEPAVKRLTIFSVTTDKNGDTTTRSSSIETTAY